MPFSRAALSILLTAAAGLLAVPGAAFAQPACGEIITQDTILTEDLVCNEDDPRIPAPDGGYGEFSLLIGADGVTLDLNGYGVSTAWEAIGVYGHRRVTIRDGLASSITFKSTSGSRISDVQRVGAGWVDLVDSDRNRITGSTTGGIYLRNADRNVIRDSSAYGEGGVYLDGADHNRIVRTTICGGMSNALSIGSGSDFNLIKDNLIPDLPDEGGGSCGGYIGQDGLTVAQDAAYNRLIGNAVLGILEASGIRVDSPQTTLRGNTANDNGEYGIEAVPGVRSGLNYARGNGNPLQCLNVRCVRGPGG